MAAAANRHEPMVPRPFVVRHAEWDTDDVFTLELEATDGKPLAFAPGQFNMVYAFGVGEVPISISGDPADPHKLVHTIRAVGPATVALSKVAPGQEVGIRGPYGSAWPVEEARGKDVVIVAGGIGLAPLRPAIYEIARNRDQYGMVHVAYGARTPGEILYDDELRHWRHECDLRVQTIVDHATRDWSGDVGVVTTLLSRMDYDPLGTIAMICGPEIMMSFSIMELGDANIASQCIYVSMERNMKCAIGFCGHCQFGPAFICKDGPVFPYERLRPWSRIRRL